MTPEQFARALAGTRLTARSADMARAVLVLGHSQAETARAHGVTPQRVSDAVKRVEREHRGIAGCPPGWSVLTVCVPPDVEIEIRQLTDAALRRAGLRVG